MKKIILSLIVLICIVTLSLNFSLKAAEIGKSYTNTDEGGSYVLTIIDEETISIFAESSDTGDTVSVNGTYYYYDEDIIDIYMFAQLFDRVKLNDETGTFESIEIIKEPIVYPCSVVIKETNYGELVVDFYEGEIGDIVTVSPKAYAFCKLDSISVNGVELIPNEDGVYQFVLTEGENVLRGNFSINQEDMQVIAGLINNAKKGNWEDLFTIENLFNLISWAVNGMFSSAFLLILIKYKKVKAKTSEEVSTTTNETVKEAVKAYLNEFFAPFMLKIESSTVTTEEISKVLARCMVLAQENTPESRLAIINELTKLQTSDSNLAVQVKSIISDEISKAQEIYQNQLDTIEKLKKANNEILNSNKNDDNSGGRV